jgi:DNA-3-methyladenine glycosylase II
MNPVQSFSDEDFISLCDQLAVKDPDLRMVIGNHGYPPVWKRSPGFETLVHIVLEQQVSLASALAAMNKLKQKIGAVNPANLLALTGEELRACYFSRQKTVYVKLLAQAILDGELKLQELPLLSDDGVRQALMKIKGIGLWSANIYLMMALQRTDIFPLGDIALVNSMKSVKQLPAGSSKELLGEMASVWKPYQTIAAFILWHAYLSRRKRSPQ